MFVCLFLSLILYSFSFTPCLINALEERIPKVTNFYTNFVSKQTGVENARLAHVVPKGSRTIWVYEKGVDRNNIGKNSL